MRTLTEQNIEVSHLFGVQSYETLDLLRHSTASLLFDWNFTSI